jgi:hypothetical protein
MKIQWVFLAALALPLSLAPSFAQVPPPEAADSGADSGVDGGASSVADEAEKAPPVYPSFAQVPFSDERTPKPKDKEWATAERVAIDGLAGMAFPTPCETRRLHEWIRIRCTTATGSIALLGGNHEGLSLHLDPLKEEFDSFANGGEIVFPVRRGDRRVIEWLTVEFGYKGANSLTPFFVLSESWLPFEERPTILAH